MKTSLIIQEVIALAVFAPFAILYMHQSVRLNYLWAVCACSARPTSCFVREPPSRDPSKEGVSLNPSESGINPPLALWREFRAET
jgi:hypothetical protein